MQVVFEVFFVEGSHFVLEHGDAVHLVDFDGLFLLPLVRTKISNSLVSLRSFWDLFSTFVLAFDEKLGGLREKRSCAKKKSLKKEGSCHE